MLNQKQISAFRAVMITGSITSAAEMLSITQPAVSRLIRDLEIRIGVPLFLRRRGASLKPTPDAITLYRDVDRYFTSLDKISQTASALRKRRVGSLRIASMPALYLSALPRFMGRFMVSRPLLDLQIYAMSSEAVIEWVQSGRCDLGFVDPWLEHEAILRRPLASIRAVAAVPAGHELAARDVLRPEDFANDDFISLTSSSQLRVDIDTFFFSAGVRRKLAHETNLSMIACSLVASGVGLAIVDSLTASVFGNGSVVFRPLDPPIAIRFAAIHSARTGVAGSVNDFIEEFSVEIENWARRGSVV